MLIISRKKDQKIMIADDVEITILEVGRNRVRFGINAPKHISIHTRLKAPVLDLATPQPVEAQMIEEPETQALPAAAGFSVRFA